MSEHSDPTLAPRRTRLIAFAILIVIAIAAIWLIDRRAIERMQTYRQQHEQQTSE